MRRTITGVALAVLTLAALVPGSPARAATATPDATLVPSAPGPYLDRQIVGITGSGLAPGEELRVAECESYGICDWWNGPSGVVGDDGTVRFPEVKLSRYFHDYFSGGTDPVMDCAHARCLLGLTVVDPDATDGYTVRAAFTLTFADVPPLLPSVTVSPSTALPAVATVAVRGTGFVPDSATGVNFCFDRGTYDNCPLDVSVTTDGTGAFDATLTVYRVGSYWDCLAADLSCSVKVIGSWPGDRVSVPLTFDPHAPVPRPTLELDRDHDLALRDTVRVTGHAFPPSTAVRISQCSNYATTGGYSCSSSATTRSDSTGALTATLPVRRYIDTPYGSPTDCADAEECVVEAYVDVTVPPTTTPIRFARHTADAAVTIGSATVVEGTSPAGTTARIPVTLDHPASTSVWVDWIASGVPGVDTATTFDDFAFSTGTLWIPAGSTSATIAVPIVADAIDEPDESFTLMATRVDGARFADDADRGTVTIRDDDPRPALRVGSTTVREADGPQFVSVPVTLNAVSGRDVTVDWVTHHDTARPGTDYVRMRGTLTIPAGRRRGTITVAVLGDRVHERSERFHVTLDDPTSATVADDDAFVTIHDDD